MKKTLLSFVIPCYRSELTIRKVYDEITETVAQRSEEYDYEIIAVNDCSPDGVLNVLRQLAAADPRVKVIDLAKNFGKHGAMMAGFSFVTGEFVICLDDDCQCPVYELWRLLDPLINGGSDCSTAQYRKKKEAIWKRFGSAVNARMVSFLLSPPNGVTFENFLAFRRFVCDEILRYPNPFPYLEGLILRTTRRIATVPMEERHRGDDQASGFTFVKSLSLLVNGLTAFSVKPLRIATVAGILFAILGFIYGLIIIIRKLLFPAVPVGYSSMMAIQLFSSGVTMIILGLIGEYIGRIYICLNRSPQYVIREIINVEAEYCSSKEGTTE